MHLDVRGRLHATVRAARSSPAWRSLESSRAWAFLRAFAAKSTEDGVPGLAAETVNPVSGAFGGGVIVMILVYLLSLALLLGGELNALRSARRTEVIAADG